MSAEQRKSPLIGLCLLERAALTLRPVSSAVQGQGEGLEDGQAQLARNKSI